MGIIRKRNDIVDATDLVQVSTLIDGTARFVVPDDRGQLWAILTIHRCGAKTLDPIVENAITIGGIH